MTTEYPVPTKITLLKKSRLLEIEFMTGEKFSFSFAKLRAASLSADVRHHPDAQSEEQYAHVTILAIERVGNYAIKPVFSDGHQTGIYSFKMLYALGSNHVMPACS